MTLAGNCSAILRTTAVYLQELGVQVHVILGRMNNRFKFLPLDATEFFQLNPETYYTKPID